jgi:uncharacterized protein (TIGR02996 family)
MRPAPLTGRHSIEAFSVSADETYLDAILANPDDDKPRLTYADWLKERGDPRGDFIHLQCRLAKMGKKDPLRPDLRARERELLERYGKRWVGRLRPWLKRCLFRRGFPEKVTMLPSVYLEHAGELARVAPIRRVVLDLTGFEIAPDLFQLCPWSTAQAHQVVPVGKRAGKLVLAMAHSTGAKLLPNVEVESVNSTADQITDVLHRHAHKNDRTSA